MATLGIIGSGQIGSTLARLAVEAGHDVVLSNSRGPETLADTVAALGPRATAATSAQAAAAGDLVVVTVPVAAFSHLPTEALAGKTVIDTCNYGPGRDGHVAALDDKSLTSSELLHQRLGDVTVVKAFNNIFYKHLLSLGRPSGAVDRSYLPIAGDSGLAKAEVAAFIDSIGYGVVDAGPLADSWSQETGAPVWGTPYGSYSNDNGHPAGEESIRLALAAATHGSHRTTVLGGAGRPRCGVAARSVEMIARCPERLVGSQWRGVADAQAEHSASGKPRSPNATNAGLRGPPATQ
ncbi:MAG: oxidoreductase coenzyme F420-dependent [Nocardioidaceae bacterium]|nr:oxidoreductase coenzyme F420-dependent [Nocardioidaceae bacterium]